MDRWVSLWVANLEGWLPTGWLHTLLVLRKYMEMSTYKTD